MELRQCESTKWSPRYFKSDMICLQDANQAVSDELESLHEV
jgi:hypothetical protein